MITAPSQANMDTSDDILDSFDFDQFAMDNELGINADLWLESESGGHQGQVDAMVDAYNNNSDEISLSRLSNTTIVSPQPDEQSSPADNLPKSIWSVPTSPASQTKDKETESLLPVCEEEARLLDQAKNSEDDAQSSDCEYPKYELRPQSRTLKPKFSSTWIDQDETGNYDPSEELRKARLRKKQVKRKDSVFSCEIFDEDAADDEFQPKVIPRLMVTLTIRSEAGKSKLKGYTRIFELATHTNYDAFSDGYRLRKRNATSKSQRSSTYDLDIARAAKDLPDDLTGHPVARGCWECLSIGHECPLLKDEREWPCTTCLDDDNDCDLVTPPLVKRACERCKRRRAACSYSYTLNHSGACKQCSDDGYRCVAGPTKEGIRTRIRIDRDWDNDPLPKKKVPKRSKYVSCMECQEEGLVCPITATGDMSQACEACTTTGRRCTIEHLLPPSISQQFVSDEEKAVREDSATKRKVIDGIDTPPPPSPPPKKLKPFKDSKGTTCKIVTKFSHPISFNHVPPQDGKKPCHFCTAAAYPLLGLGLREVEVIDWEDGRGLEEISGGHRGDDIESTRVCVGCTLSRLQVVMCPLHDLRPIASVRKGALNANAAFAELLSGTVKSGTKWCAVCPSLATYECGTGGGCGLRLCEHCMVVLTGSYDGDLQKMLAKIVDEPTTEKPLGFRADCGLLKRSGLLMRQVLSGNRF